MADQLSANEAAFRRAFAARLREALGLTAIAENGQPTQAFLAQLIVGEGGQITQPSAGNYLRAVTLPATIEQMLAVARAVSADPGWLFFGAESGAPAPTLERARERAEERRAAAAERARQMPTGASTPAKKDRDDDVAATG